MKRFSGLFFRLTPIAVIAGANALAGPVYYVTEVHADSGYAPASLNLAALFYLDFRYDREVAVGATDSLLVNGDGLPLPLLPFFAATPAPETPLTGAAEMPLSEGELAFTVDPRLASDAEEVFYTAGFTPDMAYLYRSTADRGSGDGFAGETVRFACDGSGGGGFAFRLCLTAGPESGDSVQESRASFDCSLYGRMEMRPTYTCGMDMGEVPAKIAASHADRRR